MNFNKSARIQFIELRIVGACFFFLGCAQREPQIKREPLSIQAPQESIGEFFQKGLQRKREKKWEEALFYFSMEKETLILQKKDLDLLPVLFEMASIYQEKKELVKARAVLEESEVLGKEYPLWRDYLIPLRKLMLFSQLRDQKEMTSVLESLSRKETSLRENLLPEDLVTLADCYEQAGEILPLWTEYEGLWKDYLALYEVLQPLYYKVIFLEKSPWSQRSSERLLALREDLFNYVRKKFVLKKGAELGDIRKKAGEFLSMLELGENYYPESSLKSFDLNSAKQNDLWAKVKKQEEFLKTALRQMIYSKKNRTYLTSEEISSFREMKKKEESSEAPQIFKKKEDAPREAEGEDPNL